ncbi:MAG: hypothetical protein L6R38_005762 [Xanthoria sp. 2 TBL-2021]|nr:MAG: hypothetical protein L6R38_005762 [Xanthoria sp. 2 TBL-2021]
MDDIKTMSSFQPASAPAATARSAPSPLSPTTPSEHCLEAFAPQTAPSQKRKFDTEDSPASKRQQLEPPPASTSALLPEAEVPQQASPDRQDRPSQTEGDTQDHKSQTLEITQEYDPSTRQNSRDQDSDNRDHESEDQSLNRPHQTPSAPLSKANLKLLQQEVAAFEEMDNESASSSQARKRRAPSRQTSNSDLVSGTSGRTKEPTQSHSFYRYSILDQAHVYIQSEPPSETLQTQLDVIFKRKVTDDRRREISDIAKQKSPEFSKLLRGAHREDDLVELVQKALFAIHKDDTLIHPRKADWNLDLKPTIQRQQIWNFDILGRPNVDVNKAPDRSGKRQQADRPFPSPDTSQSSIPPPAAPRVPGNTAQLQLVYDGAVKTPRPDFTWGFYQSTIIEALMERGLSELHASGFLAALQREQKLCSDPTQHFLDIRFPILVIEGKAYATGKTLFEAENQAAVSGSSMLNVQRQLASLTDDIVDLSHTDESTNRKSPLAFSLCTQGPILELWVHHIVTKGNITSYHMNLMAACHASLCDDLETFLSKVDRLLTWYKHDYLNEVVDQLFAIASHVAR